MNFTQKIEKLMREHSAGMEIRPYDAQLYDKRVEFPVANHIIFGPLSEEQLLLQVDSYTRRFPPQLLELYRMANGMNLFCKIVTMSPKIRFPTHCFCIFGFPLRLPRTGFQPFDLCIEDMDSKPKHPPEFLHFAIYKIYDGNTCRGEYGLFVHTDTGYVCSADRNAKAFVEHEHWASIDLCLCDIFERLEAATNGESE